MTYVQITIVRVKDKETSLDSEKGQMFRLERLLSGWLKTRNFSECVRRRLLVAQALEDAQTRSLLLFGLLTLSSSSSSRLRRGGRSRFRSGSNSDGCSGSNRSRTLGGSRGRNGLSVAVELLDEGREGEGVGGVVVFVVVLERIAHPGRVGGPRGGGRLRRTSAKDVGASAVEAHGAEGRRGGGGGVVQVLLLWLHEGRLLLTTLVVELLLLLLLLLLLVVVGGHASRGRLDVEAGREIGLEGLSEGLESLEHLVHGLLLLLQDLLLLLLNLLLLLVMRHVMGLQVSVVMLLHRDAIADLLLLLQEGMVLLLLVLLMLLLLLLMVGDTRGVGGAIGERAVLSRGVALKRRRRVLRVILMDKPAASAVRAGARLDPRAAQFGLVLGVTHDWAQFVGAVGELALGTVAACAVVMPGSAKLRLVAVLVSELVLNVVVTLVVASCTGC